MAYICEKPAGSCPSCKMYRFDEDSNRNACFAAHIKNRHKILANNMIEYLSNLKTFNFKSIRVDENTDPEIAYIRCLGYISMLKSHMDDREFYENTLGFTKDELIEEGMEWLYG